MRAALSSLALLLIALGLAFCVARVVSLARAERQLATGALRLGALQAGEREVLTTTLDAGVAFLLELCVEGR
ncbi:MAG: hypothetical protein OEY14_09325, partial [Myxococcales bacterium]|nr:hypothetical protein [Myxococcales bacterium]